MTLKINLFFVSLLLLLSGFKNNVFVAYTVDAKKSTIQWKGYAKVGKYSPSGTLKVKYGSITFDGKLLTAGKLVIDMTTLKHDNKQLETHLKGTDFFDVVKYPEAVFVFTSIKNKTVSGKITIRNITHEISFPISVKDTNDQLALMGNLKIDRTQFDIKFNSASYFQDLGSYAIRNDFDLSFLLFTKQDK